MGRYQWWGASHPGVNATGSSRGAGGVAATAGLLADDLDLGRLGSIFAVITAEIVAVYRAAAVLVTAFSAHDSPPRMERECKAHGEPIRKARLYV
jgi:hypothetical protein